MFETIQGEGAHTGIPSIFVRLQGCPVGCPWCDTKHTWEIKEDLIVSSKEIIEQTEESETYFLSDDKELLTLFEKEGYLAKHVVITGGEPCMYDLRGLTTLLHDNGFTTQIETSGTFEIFCDERTYVTVSPKINMRGGFEVLTSALERANEIKHPIAMQKHIDELDALLANVSSLEGKQVCLQPISQQPRATELAVKTCIARNWRLSLQTHKYIGIE
ncbi:MULTISPECIES: 7-carboxy-7-deazaguanine synthase QueE [Alteromonas]|uniref:7-carboxy-7-deazaguanine synthase n=1 Tax=Alteromonas hispanica TaxID=315421 RepID=A0A6L9MS70_9ALTE|nr:MULTISPECIES: 7-carboxy-7-deazaguanine synthase QueE [Alteromonas]APE07619.1 7-carboxy-7-deazaguanine synthase QueE [Alteromonas sp. RW2A1]MAI65642.1 7-carboxy-7-deazaguanine synthase QueE [Alteromonas sp.]NDW20813.1 7-carboxy-7-deazaguanine synthase QueE [Alteromonas hispanica]